MKIVSIANQKGGCGKTTTSINLASSLSLNGKRTLLIDLDPQAHASLGLNYEDQDSIYNVISNLTPRKLSITNIIKPVSDNFDIVPSNVLVGTLEQELADEIGRELKLLEVINEIRDNYDYVLIDCPPSLGFLTINALRACDEVIIPVETSRFSIQGVEHLMDIINLIRDRLNHEVKYKILITMFDSRLRHSFSMLAKIREQFTDVLMDTIIHINVKLKESVVMGQTVSSYDKYCRGAKDYLSLARELISDEKTAEEEAQEVAKPAQVKAQKPAEKRTAKSAKSSKVSKKAVQSVEVPVAEAQEAEEIKVERSLKDDEEEKKEEQPQEEAPEEKKEPTEAKEFQPLSEKMKSLVKEEAKDLFPTPFALHAPDAQSVYVTGSFNDWSLDENCRMNFDDGQWQVEVNLRPGVYKYQFIVDGRWREDPANPRQERNSFGDINSIIEVKANGQGGS